MSKLPLPPLEAGGLLPHVQFTHARSAVDGSTIGARLVWFRLGLTVEVDLPVGSSNPEFSPKWWRIW